MMFCDSPKLALLAFLALVCSSCTRQSNSALAGANRPPAVFASNTTSNAVDAGQGDVVLWALRRRLAADANDLDARLQLAGLYTSRGLPDLALEHYRLAAARFPDNANVTLTLVGALRDMQAPSEALRIAQEFLGRRPRESWELLSLEGVIEDEQGQFLDAEAAYRSALTIAPDRAPLHNNLGYNLLLQGHTSDAVAEFRRAIELDPDSRIAHNNLGMALASLKSFVAADALAEWQKSSGPAAAHNNLAAVLIGLGRNAEAREELMAALSYQPDFAPALANLKRLPAADQRPTAKAAPARSGSILARIFRKKQQAQPSIAADSDSKGPVNMSKARSGPADGGDKE